MLDVHLHDDRYLTSVNDPVTLDAIRGLSMPKA